MASGNYNRELFKQLRASRKELADKSGVPPFVIFHDKTLIEKKIARLDYAKSYLFG